MAPTQPAPRNLLSWHPGPKPNDRYCGLLHCRYDAAQDELLLAAGNNAGDVAVSPVHEPSDGEPAGFGPPTAWLTGAHTEVVSVAPTVNCTIGMHDALKSIPDQDLRVLKQARRIWLLMCPKSYFATLLSGPQHCLSC